MRGTSLLLFGLFFCKALLAGTFAPDLTVYYGAGSLLGIGSISKVEAEVSFGKQLSRGLRPSGIDFQLKVHDTTELALSAFRNGNANILLGSSFEIVQVFDEIDDQIFVARFKHSSEKQRLLVITRKDLNVRNIAELAGKRLILGRRGGIGEAFLGVNLMRQKLPDTKKFFSEVTIGRFANAAITDVFFGKYDVTVVCEYEYKEALALNPQLQDVLTVIDTSEPMLMLLGAARKIQSDHHRDFVRAVTSISSDPHGRVVLNSMQADTILPYSKSALANVKALYDEYQHLRSGKVSP